MKLLAKEIVGIIGNRNGYGFPDSLQMARLTLPDADRLVVGCAGSVDEGSSNPQSSNVRHSSKSVSSSSASS
jgi:hypothetical protein